MAVPILKLELAPPSTFWRLNHGLIGWAALATGTLLFAGSLAVTLQAYSQASKAGREEVRTRARTAGIEDTQIKVTEELRAVDVAKELPKWRLAERILTERSLPWSRLTAELERSMVQDVRLKSLQRTRGSDLKVSVKVKGEARTREAEAYFVECLQKNPFFEEVVLEREGERQGGGVEFEYTLDVFSTPPAYTRLPKFGPKALAPKPAALVAPVKATAPLKAPRPLAPAVPMVRPNVPVVRPPLPAAPVQPVPNAAPPPMRYPPPDAIPQDNSNRPPRFRPRPGHPGGEP